MIELVESAKSRERKVRSANWRRARSDAETEVWGTLPRESSSDQATRAWQDAIPVL
jgi:hypothetical protein